MRIMSMEFAVRTLVQMQTLLLTFVVYEKFHLYVSRAMCLLMRVPTRHRSRRLHVSAAMNFFIGSAKRGTVMLLSLRIMRMISQKRSCCVSYVVRDLPDLPPCGSGMDCSGMNLPLVITLVLDEGPATEDELDDIVAQASEGIKNCSKVLRVQEEDEEDDL